MSYQEKTGPLMANSHPGSYCGQDAYSDMFVTETRHANSRNTRSVNGSKGGDGMKDVSTIVRRLTPL